VPSRAIEGHRFLIEDVSFNARPAREGMTPCAQQQQRQSYQPAALHSASLSANV
jgi:hypothetical protein